MKTDLRIKAKDIRKSLNISKISATLVGLISKHPAYMDAKNVMLFYPTKYEMNLLGLLSEGKNFYLPKVMAQDLLVCKYQEGEHLIKSDFNIFEPCSDPVEPDVLDLVIVPALMVDKMGYRLGYGGGFYDRFLAKYPDVKTLCALPKELCIETLPHENFDIPIDIIIST